MRTIVILIMMLSSFTASQAQEITFNAIVKGVIDNAEMKKELILNGFTKINDSSDSFTDTYAFGYDTKEETAAIWVSISTLQTITASGIMTNFYFIDIQSFMPFIQENLKEDIIRNCTFEGVQDNDALDYRFKSKIGFHISSEDGTNNISVFPLFDPDSPEFEKELREWKQQEKERIEREQQTQQKD